jgi:PTS system N-acetylglucosamine-specific IIC component
MSRLPIERLQPIGRALMLPIAVLPIAGLLLRLGQPDMFHVPFIAAAGDAIFANLGLLFALGVAVGLARENHGAAGLAGVVCFLVATEGAKALLNAPAGTAPEAIDAWKTAAIAKLTVPTGILSGLVSGWLYNRYATLKAPPFLAFFEGRRFVPIAAGGAGLIFALALGYGFAALNSTFDALSRWVVAAGPIGLFLYGFLNRLLLVTGLHHIMNNVAWFIIGDFHGATGDLKRFFAGDPTAGAFMSGFFPVMMFGLPAACLAMYRAARPEQRPLVGGMLFSAALTSFLTGVTEPIEFGFVFLAPSLFVIHAILTGLAMVLMNALGAKLGFGFSAGLTDYLLNYGLATRPLLLLPVGAAYAVAYYAAFSFAIRRFDLATPGREKEPAAAAGPLGAGDRGRAFLEALGGPANLAVVDACTTRLRLKLTDLGRVDETRLRALGAHGLLRPGGDALQVVLGPIADAVAGEIRAAARAPSAAPTPTREGDIQAAPTELLDAVAPSLGGASNILWSGLRDSRLMVELQEPGAVRPERAPPIVCAMASPRPGVVHLLLRSPRLPAAQVHAEARRDAEGPQRA